jgi:hypothetical protein
MCAPVTSQVASGERPRPGSQNRARVVEEQGRDPQPELRRRQHGAEDPQRAGCRQPHGDPHEVHGVVGSVPREGEDGEDAPAELEDRERDREDECALTEGVGDGAAHEKAHEHEADEHAAHERLLGVEPVGDPGRVDPHPPDRGAEDDGVEDAERRLLVDEQVRDLGHGEHEDEVEEELGERHSARALAVGGSQEVAAEPDHRHGTPATRLNSMPSDCR